MTTSFPQNTPPSLLPEAGNTRETPPLRLAETKSPTAFRTISEVATDLEVPQHVLRFWESKFQQIRPMKRGGGRRYYRPEDIELIGSIKDLLYNQGFTIRGVQKLLKENGRFPSARSMVAAPQVPSSISTLHAPPAASQVQRGLSPEKRREIEGVLNELKALRELLRQTGI